MATNDIRSLTAVDDVSPPIAGAQNLGGMTIKANRNTYVQRDGIPSQSSGANSSYDINNIYDKYNGRFNHPTYYG